MIFAINGKSDTCKIMINLIKKKTKKTAISLQKEFENSGNKTILLRIQ
jgi:hypothetical protein